MPYRSRTPIASAYVVGYGEKGPEAITDGSSPGTSDRSSDQTVAGCAARASNPPLTSERCLRTVLNDAMSAPARRRRRDVSAFSSAVIPPTGADSIAEPPPETRAITRSPFRARSRRERISRAAARLQTSGTGCPASTNRSGPDRPSAPCGTAITPPATCFPSAERDASPIARPAFPAPTIWIPHREERGMIARTPGASSMTESPPVRRAEATRRAGSAASTAARNERSSRSFAGGAKRGGSDRLAPGQPALQQPGELREGETHDEVDYGDEQKNLRGVEHRPVVHLRCHVGELRDPHDERQRGVLDHRHELVDEGGDHVPKRLGQDDVDHRLTVGQPGRQGRLHLPLRDPQDSRAHDLRHVGGGEKRERRDDRPVRRHPAPQHGRQQEEHPEDDHQERHPADRLDDRRGSPLDKPVP